MDNKKNGIPKLRFPGFTGAWEQRKLGDYLSIPTKEPITDINELKLMTLKLNLEGITLTANRETLKLGATKYYKRHEGQLLYGKQNFFHGSIALIPKEAEGYATSGDVPALDISNVNGKYLVDYISRPSYFKAKEALATGTGSKRIHEKTLLNFKITVPSLEEQNAISDFITNYTNLITLHQRKLEHLQEQKKGLLQKMFPKNGETVPEVRFPGFTDAWEQRKLGEVADIFDGTHQTPKYTDSGIKFVSVENIATLETEKYISQKAYESEYSNKQAEKGDVLMTRIGNIGTPKLIEKDEPLAYYVTLALLKPKNIDSNFLAWGISSPKVQRNIWKLTLHIAFPKKINLGEINQVSISIPSINEQKKIGDFFKQLDSLIALHQRKLDHLELMKKGLLQQMFV